MMKNNAKPRQMGVLVGREGKQKDFSEPSEGMGEASVLKALAFSAAERPRMDTRAGDTKESGCCATDGRHDLL